MPENQVLNRLRYKFPKASRVLRRAHFLSLMKQGRRFIGAQLKIDYRQDGKTTIPKLGITVSRRYGKAHERNRFKRLVREAFRQLAPSLPLHLELHISPKTTSQQLTLDATFCDLKNLISKLHSR